MAKKKTIQKAASTVKTPGVSFKAYLRQGTVAPYVREEKWTEDPWIWHGRNNLFPEYLRMLVDNCSPLERSITMLAQFIAGNGVRFYTKEGEEIEEAQTRFQEWMVDSTEEEFLYKTAYDIAHGLGMTWTPRRSASAVVRLDHIDRFGLRSGKIRGGAIKDHYWSSDWKRYAEDTTDDRFKPKELKVYRKGSDAISVIFDKSYRPREPYYGGVFWMGAIQAAEVWTKVDNYNRVQIDTGFTPAVVIPVQFSGSEAELDAFDEKFEQAFTGSAGKGTMVIPYGTGEDPPIPTILPRGNHSGELDEIGNRCADVIYDAFGIPSLLMRDRADGLTSQGEAIRMRLQQMQRTVVAPLQKYIMRNLTRLMNDEGIPVWECKIQPLDVFDIEQTEAIVMASTTVDQAREQRGDEAADDAEWGKTPLALVKPKVDPKPINDKVPAKNGLN